jgi:hypothetical protein
MNHSEGKAFAQRHTDTLCPLHNISAQPLARDSLGRRGVVQMAQSIEGSKLP